MMIKETINNVLKSKAFYIVFSVLASIALWMYVSYIDNPDVTIPVSGITVEFLGEDTLTDNNLIITAVDKNTVTLRFTGKRNDLSTLSNSNVTVSVDLSGTAVAGVAGVHQLSYTVNYPDSISASDAVVTGASVDYITVTVEKLVDKNVSVRGSYEGGIVDGYQAEPLEFTPNTITVSGPETVITKISYAWVSLERDNLSETVTEEVPVVLMDSDGNEISSDYLILSQDTIIVTLNIVMIKEIPLTVNLIESAGATSENTIINISPAFVTVSGDPEALGELNHIVLGTIDLSKFESTTTETFSIVIPNEMSNLSGVTEATVTIEIRGLETKDFTSTNIQTANVPDGYRAEIVTKSLKVTVRGEALLLDSISLSNIRIVADLSEIGDATGVFAVTAKIYIDGFTDLGAVGEYTVTVSVTKG